MAIQLSHFWRSELLLLLFTALNIQACTFPESYHGYFYSLEHGRGRKTLINDNNWDDFQCLDIQVQNETVNKAINAKNAIILVKRESSYISRDCYKCLYVLYRTPNILQYTEASRCAYNIIKIGDKTYCPLDWPPNESQLITMFRPKPVAVNCKSTFEGIYHFTYEFIIGGSMMCNTPDNIIKACQDPGSPYVDNEVFLMTYGECAPISYNRYQQIHYQCMGSWVGKNGNLYAGILNNDTNDERLRYKCLMTNKKYQNPNGTKIRWAGSKFADCRGLESVYSGYERLELEPIGKCQNSGIIQNMAMLSLVLSISFSSLVIIGI